VIAGADDEDSDIEELGELLPEVHIMPPPSSRLLMLLVVLSPPVFATTVGLEG
jgi:hypothetical protein